MHKPSDELNICRVCGYDFGYPVWGETGTDPSWDICDCCGVEFGYQDSSLGSIRNYRARWIARGAPWRGPDERPDGWNLEEQLAQIPVEFQ